MDKLYNKELDQFYSSPHIIMWLNQRH